MLKYVVFKDLQDSEVPVKIKFTSCNGSLLCELLKMTSEGQWWGIFTEDLPVRYFLIKNRKGLLRFATRFGYMDKNDCVSQKQGVYGVLISEDGFTVDYNSPYLSKLDKTLISLEKVYKPGVPQKTYNSGLCWYSAMCFACFFCEEMRDLIKHYSSDAKLNHLIDVCLSDPTASETLRAHLFDVYNIGDNPNQNPEDDGQNGCSEFIVLCAKLKIPIVRLFAPNLSEMRSDVQDKENMSVPVTYPEPSDSSPSLLFVRCFRTRWRPKLRIMHNGKRYKLVSVMIGSEYCGHQIGASTCGLRPCRWGCSDADAIRAGIGPMFWKVKRRKGESLNAFVERWWNAWGKMIPITLFNSNSLCDFSPWNRSTCTLEAQVDPTKRCDDFDAGVVNSDFVYIAL
jgi:hypothetical protein